MKEGWVGAGGCTLGHLGAPRGQSMMQRDVGWERGQSSKVRAQEGETVPRTAYGLFVGQCMESLVRSVSLDADLAAP